MTRPRAFVTGGSGFLGRHLVTELLNAGWSVRALVRSADPDVVWRDRVEIVVGDLANQALIDRCVDEVDAVCHVAAYIPKNYLDPAEAEPCLRVNGLQTLQLASAAAARRRRFVYISGNFYRHSSSPVLETSPIAPEERAAFYMSSKFVGENYVEHLRYTKNLAAISLRVGNIFGSGMPASSAVARFSASARAGQPLQVWDGGIPTYDYVHVADVAAVAVKALASGDPGVYNVGGGGAHSVRDLAETIAGLFPTSPPVLVLPPKGVIPPSFPAMDIGKAARTWGYAPLNLVEGLRLYLRQTEPATE